CSFFPRSFVFSTVGFPFGYFLGLIFLLAFFTPVVFVPRGGPGFGGFICIADSGICQTFMPGTGSIRSSPGPRPLRSQRITVVYFRSIASAKATAVISFSFPIWRISLCLLHFCQHLNTWRLRW